MKHKSLGGFVGMVKKRLADGQSRQIDGEIEAGRAAPVDHVKIKSTRSNGMIVVASLLMACAVYALLLRMLLIPSLHDNVTDPFNYRQYLPENVRNPDYLSHSLESIMLEGLPNRRYQDAANSTFDIVL